MTELLEPKMSVTQLRYWHLTHDVLIAVGFSRPDAVASADRTLRIARGLPPLPAKRAEPTYR